MRKIILAAAAALLLAGCATYKFQHGEKPYEKGYVVSRNGYTILEYTSGADNSVPEDLGLAKRRFERRRHEVEDYYKRLGEIENNFKGMAVDPLALGFKFIVGIFKFPGVAMSDYRYEHNPQYSAKIDLLDREKEQKEAMRIAGIKEELSAYVAMDLAIEASVAQKFKGVAPAPAPAPEPAVVAPVVPKIPAAVPPTPTTPPEIPAAAPAVTPTETQTRAEGETVTEEQVPAEQQPAPAAQEKAAAVSSASSAEQPRSEDKHPAAAVSEPKAVIVAKPLKGYSPLRVRFFGTKSYSRKARIVSYHWDFGDGDTSDKANPVNTFYSGSYYPKHFAVTLTVTDNRGSSDTANILIEVLNK